MSILDILRIAGSGMTAQRLRMDVAAANLANAESTVRDANGLPYMPERVVFAPSTAAGTADAPGVEAVAVASLDAVPVAVYDPTHPDADAAGFVLYPAVEPAVEMTELMGAARAYGLNATVAGVAKETAVETIEIAK